VYVRKRHYLVDQIAIDLVAITNVVVPTEVAEIVREQPDLTLGIQCTNVA